jgi:hypothetical protein
VPKSVPTLAPYGPFPAFLCLLNARLTGHSWIRSLVLTMVFGMGVPRIELG